LSSLEIVPNRISPTLRLHRESMPLKAVPTQSTIAFSKDAFPTRRRHASEPFKSACQNKPSFVCVSRQAQFRLSFALRSHQQRSFSKANRARLDLRLGTFHPARLSP
jgi:hypothetical protein